MKNFGSFWILYCIIVLLCFAAIISTRGFTEPPFANVVPKRTIHYSQIYKEWLISSEVWVNKPYHSIVYWECDGVQYNQIDSVCKFRNEEMRKAVKDAKLNMEQAKEMKKLKKGIRKYENVKGII